ncbi:DUF459 domain-containing protein [Serratia sp. S1B]|nr:DUF459 domain-containing protein [Serratia sp. S1B]
MQTFDFTENVERALKVVFIVVITTFALIWINQSALERYWQQMYHQSAPWAKLQGHYAWDLGGYLFEGGMSASETMWLHIQGNHIVETVEPSEAVKETMTSSVECPQGFQVGLHFINGYLHPAVGLPVLFPELLNRHHPVVARASLKSNLEPGVEQVAVKKTPKTVIELAKGDAVFFVGDSLMQGVAPVIQSQLTKSYSIESINLSKQSTGLAYPKFFNWPETVRNTLKTHPNIRLMVVFLGPNDPWDMPPEGGGGGRYLRFTSPEWEVQYRRRIQDILLTAEEHQVDVIWIGPPNMRKEKLSDGVHYLSSLYQSEVIQAGQVWLSANIIFKYQGNTYSDYIGDNSSNIKLRSGDGIHFTYKGQKILADAVLSMIKFNAASDEKPEAQEETHHETTKVPVVAQ